MDFNDVHTQTVPICMRRLWLLCVNVIDDPVSTVQVIASVHTSLQELSLRSSSFRRPPSITDACTPPPHCPACAHTQHTYTDTHMQHLCLFYPINSLLCSSHSSHTVHRFSYDNVNENIPRVTSCIS